MGKNNTQSGTPQELPTGLGKRLPIKDKVCVSVCVWWVWGMGGAVQMDRGPIRTDWGHNRNQSIKAMRVDSRNLALSSSTYPEVSNKLNPAVRMAAWKEMSRGS